MQAARDLRRPQAGALHCSDLHAWKGGGGVQGMEAGRPAGRLRRAPSRMRAGKRVPLRKLSLTCAMTSCIDAPSGTLHSTPAASSQPHTARPAQQQPSSSIGRHPAKRRCRGVARMTPRMRQNRWVPPLFALLLQTNRKRKGRAAAHALKSSQPSVCSIRSAQLPRSRSTSVVWSSSTLQGAEKEEEHACGGGDVGMGG